jgi:hypothetical protein
MGCQQIQTDPSALEKKGSWHNPQRVGWPICGSIPSFSLEPANEARGVRQAPIGDQLLGLPGSYHRHAIGTFNTCSRGLIHRSLTDTDGGYNLVGVGLPQTHSLTFPTNCLHFPLMAPPGLQFNHIPSIKPKCWVWRTYGHHVVFQPLSHLP